MRMPALNNPFTYRPALPEDHEDYSGWADNWLSNGMAWASDTFTPGWCKSEDHWTRHVVDFLWADCGCCLAFRGLVLGAIFGFAIGLII